MAGLAIVSLALVLQVTYLLQASNSPLFAVPVLEAADYLSGQGSSALYSAFLTVLPEESLWWPRLLQAVLGALSCLLLWAVGRHMLSSGAALAAALIATMYGPLLFHAGQLLPAAFTVFLVLLCLWLTLSKGTTWPSVLSGFVAALAGLTAAPAIVLVPVLGLLQWRHRAPRDALWFAGCAVGTLVVATLLGGYPADLAQFSDRALGAGLLDFWRGAETTLGPNPYVAGGESPLLRGLLWHRWIAFPFGLVAPLALVGLGLGLRPDLPHSRTNAPQFRLLGAVVLAWWATALVLPATSTMRLPITPLLLLLACHGASSLLWGSHRLVAGLVAAGLVVALNVGLESTTSPILAQEHVWRGQAYDQQEMPANALREYRSALRLQTDMPVAQRRMAAVLAQRGDLAGAVELYRAYLDSTPGDVEARRDLALALSASGLHKQALGALQAAIERAPERADLHGNLAFASLLAEKPETALVAYRQVLALRPDSALVRYQLGRLHDSQGRSDSAQAQYRRALQVDATLIEAKLVLADLLVAQNELTEAEDLLQQVLAADTASLPARWKLGRLLARSQRYAEAITCFNRMLKLAPEEYEAHLYLGGLYRRLGDQQQSAESFSAYETQRRARQLQAAVRSESEELARRFLDGTSAAP